MNHFATIDPFRLQKMEGIRSTGKKNVGGRIDNVKAPQPFGDMEGTFFSGINSFNAHEVGGAASTCLWLRSSCRYFQQFGNAVDELRSKSSRGEMVAAEERKLMVKKLKVTKAAAKAEQLRQTSATWSDGVWPRYPCCCTILCVSDAAVWCVCLCVRLSLLCVVVQIPATYWERKDLGNVHFELVPTKFVVPKLQAGRQHFPVAVQAPCPEQQ